KLLPSKDFIFLSGKIGDPSALHPRIATNAQTQGIKADIGSRF
ncbi:MAG: hypothetical protein ACJA16_002516, partial [Akkermansiaceae bacterium]